MEINTKVKNIENELIEERFKKTNHFTNSILKINYVKYKNCKKKFISINSNKLKNGKYPRNYSENKNNNLLNKTDKKILNMNSKQNNINIKFFFKLLIIFIYIPFSENKLRKLDFLNEITLIIKMTENYKSFLQEDYKPNEVIINGVNVEIFANIYKFDEPLNTVIIRWNYSFNKTTNMFYNVDILLSIDLSNFDSSKITDMSSMFYGCSSLTSINFKNFKTSSVTNMENMFNECHSLASLDLSNFDTSLVTTMKYMFVKCFSLVTLDLSSFNTTYVQDMDSMFYNAQSLASLDLSNFNTSSLKTLTYFLYDCKSLRFLNLKSFVETNDIKAEFIIMNIHENATYCIDSQKAPRIYEVMQQFNKNNDCNNDCFTGKKKLILEKNECIDDCKKDEIYIYEINNICYDSITFQSEYNEASEMTENLEENEITNSEKIISTEKEQNSEILDKDTEYNTDYEENSENIKNNEKSEIEEKSNEQENNKTEILEKEKSDEDSSISQSIEKEEITQIEKIDNSHKLINSNDINIQT